MTACPQCGGEGQHPECARAAEDLRRYSGCSDLAPLRFMRGPEREFIARVHPGAARRCGFDVREYL